MCANHLDSVHPEGAFHFEGPEKRLEIVFTGEGDMRDVQRPEWDTLLRGVGCEIQSTTVNDFIVSYVLSESSLFVCPRKVVIKTCGRTSLLNGVDAMLMLARARNLTWVSVQYTRKNFLRPSEQPDMHRSFEDETRRLLKSFPSGRAHTMGCLLRDHWNFFYAVNPEVYGNLSDPDFDIVVPVHEPHSPNGWVDNAIGYDRIYSPGTIEIMMHDLPIEVMEQFFSEKDGVHLGRDSKSVTDASGISKLIPGSVIDDFLFDPCGYSMNGLHGSGFWTIHITPEDKFSYVSFEAHLESKDYQAVIRRVLELFRPGRMTCAFVGFPEQMDTFGLSTDFLPTDMLGIKCKFNDLLYRRRERSMMDLAEGKVVVVENYCRARVL